MWPRLRGTAFLFFSFQTSFPADTPQSLRNQYGQPISESYLVRPGIVASASYGASGHICEIVVSPQRLWNSTFDSKQLTEIVNEIVPESQRGKYLMGTFVNAVCFPTQDCNGTAGTWEKVNIFRNGGTDAEHYASIQWSRDECRTITQK
jgi:hypothetical protein